MNGSFPRFFRLRQLYPPSSLPDAAVATRAAMAELPASDFIRPGMKVAVGAGSRGIANHAVVVRAVCEELKKLGAEVFIVPAMGSHGGATEAGQLEVLAHAGITERGMGVPIRSSMETVELGRVGDMVIYQDRNAASADAVVLVNRIKPHTDFHGPIESGLIKMAVIGLGKQKGAHQFHEGTVRMGHAQALLTLGRELLRRSRIVFGIGLVENQLHETARVVALPTATMETREMALLEEARRLMARLPFSQVDLLMVDEMGKNISGSGMDTNVVRRETIGSFIQPGEHPVLRIYARSLHPESYGNAVGIGLADFVHDRLVAAMDPQATRINALTSLMPANARVPMSFRSDRAALEAALQTIGRPAPETARVVWIKNTLSCGEMLASEACLDEARHLPGLELRGDLSNLSFDEQGDLLAAF